MRRTWMSIVHCVAATLAFGIAVPKAEAITVSVSGSLSSFIALDVWEIKCRRGTEEFRVRAVATGSAKFRVTVLARSPRTIYSHAVVSEVFIAGGVASEVALDRPDRGSMRVLAIVQQTGGTPGDTYYVNLTCFGDVVAEPTITQPQDQ